MGEVFEALLAGKVVKYSCYKGIRSYVLISMIGGELYSAVNTNSAHKWTDEDRPRKWDEGSFLFNEPESYSVYVKEEGSPRTYTTKEAAELLEQGKKIQPKIKSCGFYYYVDKLGFVATSYGTRIYYSVDDFLSYLRSDSEWVEYSESEEDEFSDYVEYT